jgi:hypothetical protein
LRLCPRQTPRRIHCQVHAPHGYGYGLIDHWDFEEIERDYSIFAPCRGKPVLMKTVPVGTDLNNVCGYRLSFRGFAATLRWSHRDIRAGGRRADTRRAVPWPSTQAGRGRFPTLKPALLCLARTALSPAASPSLGKASAVSFCPVIAHDSRSRHRRPDNAVLCRPVTGGGRRNPKSIYDVFCSHVTPKHNRLHNGAGEPLYDEMADNGFYKPDDL